MLTARNLNPRNPRTLSPTSTCNPDLIEAFLADRLSEAQQAAFEQILSHLGKYYVP